MKRIVVFTVAAAVALLAAGCSRDPEKAKRRYLENGDKYLSQGKLKEASIMYRNAIKKDPRFGEAYAKLGEVELRRGDVRSAAGAFRRAVELLPGNEEASARLADIYLAAYSVMQAKNDNLMREVRELTSSLLAKNPKSYQGLRLRAFVAVGEKKLGEAVEYFRQADEVKPDQPELLFAMAQVLNQDQNWPECEKTCLRILDKSPNYIPAYDFLALSYVRRNRPQDADAIMKRKVAAFPKVPEYRLQQAGLFRAAGNKAEADKIISSVLAEESTNPAVRMKVGGFLVRTRDLDGALKVYSEGLQKYPAEKTAYRLRLAEVYVAQAKPLEAVAIVQKAVEEDPKNDTAISTRAALDLQYGGQAKQQGAINDLQGLLSRQPKDVVVRYNLARAYQARGEWDAARIQYSEAIRNQPNFVSAYVGLGQVYLAKRDYGKAITTADELFKIDAKNLAARVIKSNALTNSGNLRQARMDLENYLQETPNAPDLRFQLAIVDFLEDKLQVAEASFRKLRLEYPNDPRLMFAVAEVMLRTNRQAEALKFLGEESAKHPESGELRVAYANTALRIDQVDIAEREYKKILETNPKDFEVYLKLGETVRRKGQVQASIEYLKKGQQLNPTSAAASLQLAMTLDSAGMKQEAFAQYENAVKYDQENAIALNNLAFMLADEGRDLDRAQTYAERAKRKLPSNDLVSDTLSWVYIKKKLNQNAITILKDLTARNPHNATFHYHYGVALLQSGDKQGARQKLQSALTMKPTKEEEAKIREYLSQA
jgi:tetratricopeptide (TPR) repeat protein